MQQSQPDFIPAEQPDFIPAAPQPESMAGKALSFLKGAGKAYLAGTLNAGPQQSIDQNFDYDAAMRDYKAGVRVTAPDISPGAIVNNAASGIANSVSGFASNAASSPEGAGSALMQMLMMYRGLKGKPAELGAPRSFAEQVQPLTGYKPATPPVSGSAPSPAAPSGPSTLPRVNSGEGVLNQALTSLDNKTLVKVAKSRGLDITAEAQLKPEMGNPRLIRKLMDSFTGDELDNARDMGIEISRNQPVESNGIPPEAAKEAWRYKVLNTFFPDVAMPKSMLARVGDTLAAQAKARSDAAQFNSIRSQAEGAANAIPMDQPLTGQDLIQALRNMTKTAGK